MAAVVAILGSLGVIGLVVALLRADAGHKYPAALRWGIGGASSLALAVMVFVLADVSGAVWFVPAGVLVAAVALVVLAT